MSNHKFDWEQIFQDCVELIALPPAGKKPISSISELHKELKNKYEMEGKNKEIPSLGRFGQVMHKRLNLAPNQKAVKSALYQLGGQYDKMTLNLLVENAVVVAQTTDSSNWLFIRLKNIVERGYTDVQKHLYHLSHKLKRRFSSQILYICFDPDTIVILCTDNAARQEVLSYFRANARAAKSGGCSNGESNI